MSESYYIRSTLTAYGFLLLATYGFLIRSLIPEKDTGSTVTVWLNR